MNSTYKSDTNLKEGWYRFIGEGGDQVVSSCARVPNNMNKSYYTIYNLFTCNSSINYTDYKTCSGGFTVYFLRPSKTTYTTCEKIMLSLCYKKNLSMFLLNGRMAYFHRINGCISAYFMVLVVSAHVIII